MVSFAEAELGLTLRPGQAAILADFEQGRYSQAVRQCGRRGVPSHRPHLRPKLDTIGSPSCVKLPI